MKIEENAHECAICQISFSMLNTLAKHNALLHSKVGNGTFDLKIEPESQSDQSIGKKQNNSFGDKPLRVSPIKIKITQSLKNLESGKFNIYKRKLPYSCQKCQKCFKKISLLKRHELLHTGEKPFSCQYCGFRSRLKHNLKGHEKSHQNEKPFSCAKCFKRFKYANYLKIHDQIHSANSIAKTYSCKYCNKKFNQIGEVIVHERYHTGEKPFPCRFCEKTFSQLCEKKKHELHQRCEKHPNRKLKNDMKTHKEICETNSKKLAIKSKLPKPCKVDPESYNIQSVGKEQKNSSKQMPIKVSPIKIKIKLKSNNLETRRSKSYQSVKSSFSCKFCTKSFSEAGNLKKHLKVHVNEVQHEIANLDKATKKDSILQEKFGIKPVMVVLYRLENEICRSMKIKSKLTPSAFEKVKIKTVKEKPVEC